MKLEEMSAEELINHLIDKCRYYPESKSISKISIKLIDKLDRGDRAIKAVDSIIDQYRSGK